MCIICNEIDWINPSTTERDVKLSISSHRTSKEDRLSSRQRRFLQRADPTLLFLFFPPLRGQRGEREKIPTGRKEGKKDTLSYSYSSLGEREKVAFFVRACMEVKEKRNNMTFAKIEKRKRGEICTVLLVIEIWSQKQHKKPKAVRSMTSTTSAVQDRK